MAKLTRVSNNIVDNNNISDSAKMLYIRIIRKMQHIGVSLSDGRSGIPSDWLENEVWYAKSKKYIKELQQNGLIEIEDTDKNKVKIFIPKYDI